MKKRGGSTTMVSRSLIVPDRFFTKLRYYDVDTPFINLSTNYAFRYYYGNALYDINPSLASSQVPGVTALQGLYHSYRVHAMKIVFEVANTTLDPLLMTLHQQTDFSTTAFNTWAKIVSLAGNKYTKQRVIGPSTGMDRGRLSLYVDFSVVNGSKLQYIADSDYTGTLADPLTSVVGSNPNNLFFVYAILSTIDGSPVSASSVIPIRVEITQYVELFRRIDTYA